MMPSGPGTPSTSDPLPQLRYLTDGLPAPEALAQWRQLMSPLFHIDKARYTSAQSRGNLYAYVVGEIIVDRCTFNAQHIWRDPALIAATPNHLVIQSLAGRPS